MSGRHRNIAAMVGLGLLFGCAPQNPLELRVLPKGEQVSVAKVLAENPGKLGCINYEAETNSCTSLIEVVAKGDRLLTREAAVLVSTDGVTTQRVEVQSISKVQGDQLCARARDISVVGRDETSVFLQDITRGLVAQVGGSVCSAFFRAGDAYVMSSFGSNAKPYPPGDSALSFVSPKGVRLRAQ